MSYSAVGKIVSILILLMLFCSCERIEDTDELARYKNLRKEKNNQARPLIHNNDGGDATVFPVRKFDEFSIFNFLNVRSTGLIGSDVNTISYCTSRSFNLFLHNTIVGEVISKSYANSPSARNIVPELFDLGTDPLEVTAEFAHTNGFELFWSHRMNDTHDAAHRSNKPHPQWNNFKEEHPEYLFGDVGDKLPYGRWSAVDFSHKEVRDLCVQFFTEVCENYDVDGVELDFFRHLYIFRNVAKGEIATEEQLELLTDMVVRIREMTERVGRKKGKPILLLTRVPDSFEYCRKVGIDLEVWMKRGLIDIVVGSGYFRLNPWVDLVKQGQKYGVKVYAGLSESRIKKGQYPGLIRNQNAVYRARAAAAWEAEIDGIYSFNEFNVQRQYLREIGEPEKLNRTNNLYFVTYRNGNPNAYLKDGKDYLTLPMLSPVNPVPIGLEPMDFMVEIGNEDNPASICIILYTKDVDPENLEVHINKTKVPFKKSTKDGLIVFDVPNNAILPGMNNLVIKNLNSKISLGPNPTLFDAAILFHRNSDDPELKELVEICF